MKISVYRDDDKLKPGIYRLDLTNHVLLISLRWVDIWLAFDRGEMRGR